MRGTNVCVADVLSDLQRRSRHFLLATAAAVALGAVPVLASAQTGAFQIEEATIDDIQAAIRGGATTCEGVVRAYVARIKAYNGVCTAPVTANGAPIPAAFGPVRGGAPLAFPTETVAASAILPNLDQYAGKPLEFGRMEATASDPSVQQQYGMVTGIAGVAQVNAYETLNLRGERSVTCKGDFDAPPGEPLPAGAPAVCEKFRQQPDMLERAAELDRQYGRSPDLASMPMYCAVISVKNWYDISDVRSTGGNDVNYASDVPPWDMTIVTELRNKGAIISGTTVASELGFRAAGPTESTTAYVGGNTVRATWGGTTCNPYDTTRSPGGSSGGAGASVAANLATCAICETTGGSCRIPANANAVASFVTTKGLTSEFGSATADFINHRPGVLCRTLGDAARVVDAMKNPTTGFFDTRDFFTAQPRSLEPTEPYASSIVTDASTKPLEGIRVGIVREYMVKHSPNDGAIVDLTNVELTSILRDKLGAELVETADPAYPDDPSIPNVKYSFADALAQILPIAAPEFFFRKDERGSPVFAVPGYDVTTRDYLVKLSLGRAPLSPKVNLRGIRDGIDDGGRNAFMIARYLAARGDNRIRDMADYAASSKWRSEDQAVGALNLAAANQQDTRAADGLDRVKMHTLYRYALQKVMLENDIDVLVHPNITIPMGRIGYASEPDKDGRRANGFGITDTLGVPEIIVPAGFNTVEYTPQFVLGDDRKTYAAQASSVKTTMEHPVPFSLQFWAGPGDDPVALKVASAYEAASHHRKPPAAFPALPEPQRISGTR